MLITIANTADPFNCAYSAELTFEVDPTHVDLKIGVLRDSAFQFYYPENLSALTATGAKLVEITALEAKPIPKLDTLYIGGGFPETHAECLATSVTKTLAQLSDRILSGVAELGVASPCRLRYPIHQTAGCRPDSGRAPHPIIAAKLKP